MSQNRVELFRIGLQLGEMLAGQVGFIRTSNRVEVGVTKEQVRKLGQEAIFKLGRTEPARRATRQSGNRAVAG